MYQLNEEHLILENDNGQKASFEKKLIDLSFQLDKFSLYTSLKFDAESKVVREKNIGSRVSDVDLHEFKKEVDVEGNDYEIEEEMDSELKILYNENNMVRFKTISPSFWASIQIGDGENQTRICHRQQGFFSVLTLYLAVEESIFATLSEAIINDSLKSISVNIGVPAFDLGAELGLGYSGIALSNDERAIINQLSFEQGHSHQGFLNPRLARIEKLLEKLAGEDQE